MTTARPQTNQTNQTVLSNADYQSLIQDIKTTIDKNDNLFQQIQQANYPNAGNYTSDLLNYKIETEGKNLEEVRMQVWNYLTRKYAENTKLRDYYFTEIRKADDHIGKLERQQQELLEDIQKKQLLTSTASQSIKQQKYQYDKHQYYLFLYKILVFVQIAILALLVLCLTGFIPRATCLVIIVIVLIAAVAFVGYYVFYVNVGRSAFNWGKFEHDNSIKSATGNCADSDNVSEKDKKKKEVDKAVESLIKKSNEKCDS